jgi:hypothetical protein
MLIKAMATHEVLTKKKLNSIWKKKKQHCLPKYI